MNGNNRGASYVTIHFDSFESEHILKEIKTIHRKEKYKNKYL